MPTFEFTSPEGKTYEVQGPDGATKEQAFQMLQKQLGSQPQKPPQDFGKLPLEDRVSAIPGNGPVKAKEPDLKARTVGETLKNVYLGPFDAALAVGANAVAAPLATAAGAVRSMTGGKYGTKEGVKQGEDFAKRLEGAAYHPRTEAGKAILSKFADLVDRTKMGAVVPEMGMAPLARAAGMQAGSKAGEIAADATDRARGLIPRKVPQMVGVGAAETGQALQRKTDASMLPVPIPLTKGQQTRDFGQLRFERETAKEPQIGKPLRERYAQQNEALQKNIGAFDDATGSQQRSLRGVGQSVIDALAEKDAVKSKAINQAYNKARQAGEMKEPVPLKTLNDYLAANRSSAKNAPILSAVQAEIKRLTKGKGDQLSINDMEELRKFINRTMNEAGPDMKFAPEMKKIIDSATEGKGGDLYRQARRLAENHAREFSDRAVIRNLMDMKKGDRKVAVEDVFQKSVLSGSLDDVRHLRRVLQTGGEKGQQAWKELQGQTLRHMQDAVTASAKLDDKGNTVFSADKFNKLVNELDSDGRLDFMFGKQGADQIRTLNDISKVVLTVPEGAVNHSNTASVAAAAIADSLGSVGVSIVSGHPVGAPLISAANYGRMAYKNRKLANQVRDSLDEPIPAKQ